MNDLGTDPARAASTRPHPWPLRLGAAPFAGRRCRFVVWAPNAERVELELDDGRRFPLEPRTEPLPPLAPAPASGVDPREPADGYFEVTVDGVAEGDRYRYRLDDEGPLADPASRFQPDDVDGPSEIAALPPLEPRPVASFRLEQAVFYELHVGTFTEEGTLDAAAERLDELRELGVTAVELMPLAEFPGERNWGYDGVFPFAVESAYGGPAALVRFVDACHARDLAVVLDVVYNHLGPEGNVLPRYGPCFTDRYRTPWGAALDFDGEYSGPVRRFFLENALYWLFEVGVDALRLDAVHAIADVSERPFLAELSAAVEHHAAALGVRRRLIGESARNSREFLRPRSQGGCGLDAQWCDDFHHALHVALTDERDHYYVDFGGLEPLAEALRHGFVYRGQYSRFRGRRHGVDSAGLDGARFVVCAQNHDQIGNRARGERLSTLVSPEKLRLAAGCVLLSPFLPLLFMGEEHADRAPFLYFVDHRDPELVAAVREGRRREFAGFAADEVPDPAAEETFLASRPRGLEEDAEQRAVQRALRRLHGELLALRSVHPALGTAPLDSVATRALGDLLVLERRAEGSELLALFNFGDQAVAPAVAGIAVEPPWTLLYDATAELTATGEERRRLPERLDREGLATLELTPLSFAVWQRSRPVWHERSSGSPEEARR